MTMMPTSNYFFKEVSLTPIATWGNDLVFFAILSSLNLWIPMVFRSARACNPCNREFVFLTVSKIPFLFCPQFSTSAFICAKDWRRRVMVIAELSKSFVDSLTSRSWTDCVTSSGSQLSHSLIEDTKEETTLLGNESPWMVNTGNPWQNRCWELD